MEENAKLEAACNSMTTGSPEDLKTQLMELTKQNSILDLNLLRLTRKYTNLEEQEKMLRREYHKIEADTAEKDRFLQERISKLKEWKAKAMQ